MNVFDVVGRLYRDEAPADGGEGGGGGAGDGGGDSLLPEAAPGASGEGGDQPAGNPAAAPEWFLSDGVKGEGAPPEWFKSAKYKTLAEQAKAYTALESKLGAFTGAPEGDYELTMPEGVEGEFFADDPMLERFKGTAKELGISQEGFEKLLHMYVNHEVETAAVRREAELKALGPEADKRLGHIAQWGANNLDPAQYETLRAVATTAAGVQLIESMMGMTREGRIAPGGAEGGTVASGAGHTPDSLRAMKFAKDDSGQFKTDTDPQYAKAVREAYREYYGAEPAPPKVVQGARR